MQATSKTYSPIPSDGTRVLKVRTAPGGADLDELRGEIDQLDTEILRLIRRRTEVSRSIGVARMAAGGTRIVHSREIAVLARFRELGLRAGIWPCCCCGSAVAGSAGLTTYWASRSQLARRMIRPPPLNRPYFNERNY